MYPVDLPDVDGTDLTAASQRYLSSLESRPGSNEWFQSSKIPKVQITASNISQLQLFEDDQPACVVLALHPLDDQSQVLALYLHEKWWPLDDVLQTSSKSRSGLVLVQSITERLILFLLSQVVERPPGEEPLFSRHPRTENCKLLWRDGWAVGFYTIKHKGSLCDSWSSCCYLLPVLDTALVRRSCRRRGFGFLMLEDFCSSFSAEDFLGISSPLSPSMGAVLRKFLQQHDEHRDRLYEVEAPGNWTQRRNIWLNIQLGRYSFKGSPTLGEAQRNEAHNSSEETCALDLPLLSTCNVNAPLLTGSTEVKQVKPCDPGRGGGPPSSEMFETGCSPAAHASDLDSRAHSLNTEETPVSAQHCREGPEEIQSAKRARRT